MHPLIVQALAAVGWYAAIIALTRIAGKRFAGQTSIIDLVVLITLGVVLQGVLLQKGAASAAVFVVVVFGVHRGLAVGCRRWAVLRHVLRGRPRLLIINGVVEDAALAREDVSLADLKAGLRKAGYARLRDVKTATLEETGQISAVGYDGDCDCDDDDDDDDDVDDEVDVDGDVVEARAPATLRQQAAAKIAEGRCEPGPSSRAGERV